jgi:hypothetical protein
MISMDQEHDETEWDVDVDGGRDYKNMKVSELRDELQARGLSTKGLKKDLLERLEEVLNTEKQQPQTKIEQETIQEDPKPISLNLEAKTILKPSMISSDKIAVQSQDDKQILQISNLVRPFTHNQLLDLLSTYGKVSDFWMNSIKSNCFANFSSLAELANASQELQGMVWPKGTGCPLSVSILSMKAATQMILQENQKTGTGHRDGFSDLDLTLDLEHPQPNAQEVSSVSESISTNSEANSKNIVHDKLSMSLSDISKMSRAESHRYRNRNRHHKTGTAKVAAAGSYHPYSRIQKAYEEDHSYSTRRWQ